MKKVSILNGIEIETELTLLLYIQSYENAATDKYNVLCKTMRDWNFIYVFVLM